MRSLRILCVQLGFHSEYPDVSTAATTYNDGIYYVASFLERELEDARVEMCQMFWGQSPGDFPLESYDYILVSALGTHFWSNISALEVIRDRRGAGSHVIFGGPHATFAPHEVLEFADFVILGEGEIPALNLIQTLEERGSLDAVDNLCYCVDGRLVMNKIKRYGSLDTEINPGLLRGAPRLHWATVSMSRGCPYNCSFCYAIRILGRKFRPKDVRTIVHELDGIYAETGCSRFYVTDLNFTTNDEFCNSVATALRDRNYHFIAMSRIELADNLDLLDRLKQAGFHEYCLGVESEDESVLKTFNKAVDASLQTQRLRWLAENDLYIHSAIIYGLESQDETAIERTARWCADARIMHPTFVCLAEYPFQKLLFGSRQDIEDHRIIMENPTYQHYSFVGIYPRHMRPSVLQRCIVRSYELFFERAFELESRPRRRMRLKAYSRSVRAGLPGMERHIQFLEKLERRYYNRDDTLNEQLLADDFENRFGDLRERLTKTIHHDPDYETTFKL